MEPFFKLFAVSGGEAVSLTVWGEVGGCLDWIEERRSERGDV